MADDLLDPAWLDRALAALLPREGARWRMRLVPWKGQTTGVIGQDLWGCIEKVSLVVVGDGPVEERQRVTDVTILMLAKARSSSRARGEAYLAGWLNACAHVLDRLSPEHVGLALPRNLSAPKAFELARPSTKEEWTKALLAPSRLGRLLGPAPGRFLGGQG
jgi:hypothetical protein